MASKESNRVRATLSKEGPSDDVPFDIQRREWEEAALKALLPSRTIIEPIIVDGIHCERVSSGDVSQNRIMLFLHGGGFNGGSSKTHRELAARLSMAAKIPVLLPDYSLAPEHPYPAAIEDVVKVYRWLINNGTQPNQIVFGGDSAGGGLVISSLMYLRDQGDPMPAAAVLLSAWLDLTLTGETMVSRAVLDPMITRAVLARAIRLYIGDRDATDPLISPVYADLRGLPPLLIHVGDHEILLSDSLCLAEKAKDAGVEVTLEVWPEMWHVWHSWAASMPEAQQAIDRIGQFMGEKIAV